MGARLVVIALVLAGCHADSPGAAARPSPPVAAPAARAASSAPAAPALAPPVVAAPDVRALALAFVEGVEIDEPRTTEDRAESTQAVLTGIVRDFETGEALVGVTVIAASPSIAGEQAAITDENGSYVLELPPATYTATFYYVDATTEETDLVLAPGKMLRLANTISTITEMSAPPPPEAAPPPDSDYESIPVPGRTFEAALGAAAGSQEDSDGVSFSSHCGLENVYVVDQ